jgi:hypothetical protein
VKTSNLLDSSYFCFGHFFTAYQRRHCRRCEFYESCVFFSLFFSSLANCENGRGLILFSQRMRPFVFILNEKQKQNGELPADVFQQIYEKLIQLAQRYGVSTEGLALPCRAFPCRALHCLVLPCLPLPSLVRVKVHVSVPLPFLDWSFFDVVSDLENVASDATESSANAAASAFLQTLLGVVVQSPIKMECLTKIMEVTVYTLL